MTQEEKELLLKDLCARLSYGVIVYDYDREETREMGLGTLHDIMFNDLKCKPYLRLLSSMTEEERKEFDTKFHICTKLSEHYFAYAKPIIEMYQESIDWLNEHHFDYRGLIEKGLALEAPEGMYK